MTESIAPFILRPGASRAFYRRVGPGTADALAAGTWPPKEWAEQACANCGIALCRKGDVVAPFPIPLRMNQATNSFEVSGVLVHGPSCALRYAIDRGGSLSSTVLPLIHLFAEEVFGLRYQRNAVPVTELRRYGGLLSDDDYLTPVSATVTVMTDRMVPAMVIAQLRQTPGDVTEDVCSVRWNVMDVVRPAHMPQTPAVRTEPVGTEFDRAAQAQSGDIAVAAYSGTDDDDDEAELPPSPIAEAARTRRGTKRVRIAPLGT